MTGPPRPSGSREQTALIARLLARDEAAFVGLVRAEQAALVRLAQVFVASRATAEEVVQDTWAAVLDGLGGFERRSSLRTWIFRICVNRAKTRAARDARMVSFEAEGTEEPEAGDRFDPRGHWALPPRPWQLDGADEILARREALASLEAAIEELPPAQRAVIVLRDIEGIDSESACNVLQVSESNQRVLLHRARAKVRRALEGVLGRGQSG